MKIAYQIDPIEDLNHQVDSSLQLAFEAQKRGFNNHYYTVDDLFFSEGKLFANTRTFHLDFESDNIFSYEEKDKTELSTFDVILIRQDPPFDMKYITSTFLLDKIKDKVLIVNNPASIRNHAEKLYVLDFLEFTPPTLISNSQNEIEIFLNKYQDIVIKPLYSFGGTDISRIKSASEISTILKDLHDKYDTPFVVQKYLPEIKTGDVRVLISCGDVLGGFIRVPEEGKLAANLVAGGTAKQWKLTEKQQKISELIAKELNKKDLHFVGLDFIGDYITEINVTSPTGIKMLSELNNFNVANKIWDGLLTKINN